jgi:peptidoglycan/xylan/chitin deacetylase (PgdA/CDA1 family)
LDILERFGVRATFSCCGQALERNPKVAQAIVRRGHEVAAQGYRFVSYAGLDVETERREHARAVAAIEGVTGVRPRGWSSRIPSVNTRALLMENGQFLYDSDSYADDLPYFVHADTGRLLIIPHSFDLNDRKFSPPPSVAGFGSAKNFTSALRASFDRLYAEGVEHPQMMSIGLHPRLSGRPMRAAAFGTFLEYATSVRRVWFAPRLDIANYWIRLSRGGTSSGHVEEWR